LNILFLVSISTGIKKSKNIHTIIFYTFEENKIWTKLGTYFNDVNYFVINEKHCGDLKLLLIL